ADARDAPSVFYFWNLGQKLSHVVPVIRCDALEPADCHGFLLHAPASACRLAGPVAYAPQNAREHVGLAIHHVGVGESPLCNQSDVLRDVSVSWASPLAIHDSVVIVGMRSICWLHSKAAPVPWPQWPCVHPV